MPRCPLPDYASASPTPRCTGEARRLFAWGLRGLAYFDIVVSGPRTDVHSGSFGGGIANPANALAKILARLHDESGGAIRRLSGSMTGFAELTPGEREELARLEHDDAAWFELSGAPSRWRKPDIPPRAHLGSPDLRCVRADQRLSGPRSKTIIPATASAKAPPTRARPGARGNRSLFEAHLRRIAPPGVSVTLRYVSGGLPYPAPTTTPIFAVAQRAFRAHSANPPSSFAKAGRSPSCGTIADMTGKPCLLMGFGQPDENAHAPNEWLFAEVPPGNQECGLPLRRTGKPGRIARDGARLARRTREKSHWKAHRAAVHRRAVRSRNFQALIGGLGVAASSAPAPTALGCTTYRCPSLPGFSAEARWRW